MAPGRHPVLGLRGPLAPLPRGARDLTGDHAEIPVQLAGNRPLRQTTLQQRGDAGKVFLVAGGLSNTYVTLDRLGISRLSYSNTETLQPLHEQEVIASLEAFLNNEDFCIDGRGCGTTLLQQLVINESFGAPTSHQHPTRHQRRTDQGQRTTRRM